MKIRPPALSRRLFLGLRSGSPETIGGFDLRAFYAGRKARGETSGDALPTFAVVPEVDRASVGTARAGVPDLPRRTRKAEA